jgi:hypothetical protein
VTDTGSVIIAKSIIVCGNLACCSTGARLPSKSGSLAMLAAIRPAVAGEQLAAARRVWLLVAPNPDSISDKGLA